MFKSLILTSLALACVQMVSSHLCMMDPPSRDFDYDLGTPGWSACKLKTGPCGDLVPGQPVLSLKGLTSYSVRFQQNANHYYVENPGRMMVDYAKVSNPTEDDFSPLYMYVNGGAPVRAEQWDINQLNEAKQTNFTLRVKVPNVDCDNCVFRVRYQTNNPLEDYGTFYQCSDVKIESQEIQEEESVVDVKENENHVEHEISDLECCVPDQMTISGLEVMSWRQDTKSTIYFDRVNQLIRYDTQSGYGEGVTNLDGTFQMFSNWSSGIEYYYNVNTRECKVFGLNFWSDWCYGSYNHEYLLDSASVNFDTVDTWALDEGTTDGIAHNAYQYSNLRHDCTPFKYQRKFYSDELTVYSDMKKSVDSDVFNPPQDCLDAYAMQSKMTGGRFMKSPLRAPHMKL